MLRSRRPPGSRRRLLVATTLLAAVAAQPGARATTAVEAPVTSPSQSTAIVVLRPGALPATVAERHGLRMGEEFQTVFNGFGAVGDTAAPGISQDPDVAAVVPNETFHLDDEFLGLSGGHPLAPGPTPGQAIVTDLISNVSRVRVGVYASPTAAVDFDNGPGVDADIAIVDTGIDRQHPDLNVAGGYNCTNANRDAWQDDNSHGTAVAGVAAMKDDAAGGVGVAPGARLWAVKIFDATGTGTLESVLCGVEWVSDHASLIDVANMSFGGTGRQDAACGQIDGDLLHTAICRLTQRNVTVVAAAGNLGGDAADARPASYPEVITVSAFDDTDGLPGALGRTIPCDGQDGLDDHLATFSDHGAPVDIAAPGVCIPSTFPLFRCGDLPNCYGVLTGTSLAAPFVSGAAALLKTRHPDWSPVEVRAFLVASAEAGPIAGDEADPYHEGVLSVVGY